MKKLIGNKKVKLPDENVEYTLIFPGNKLVTYVFCGVNDKGRLILMNVKTKTFTTMSPGWFRSLTGKRGQLVSKKAISTENTPKTQSKNENFVVQWREDTFEAQTLRTLRNLTPAMAVAIHGAIGYSADKLADELEGIFLDKTEEKYSNEYCSRVFKALMIAQDIYLCK